MSCFNRRGVLVKALAWLLVVVALAACQGAGIARQPDPERLKSRLEGYIQARIKRDLTALQAFYLDPGAAQLGNISYLESRVDAVEVNEKRAAVLLKNKFQVMGFTFKDVPQKMVWKWEKGDWYVDTTNAARTPFGKIDKGVKMKPVKVEKIGR